MGNCPGCTETSPLILPTPLDGVRQLPLSIAALSNDSSDKNVQTNWKPVAIALLAIAIYLGLICIGAFPRLN